MGYERLRNYAWIPVWQDTNLEGNPFNISVYYRGGLTEPYNDIALGIRIRGVENFLRFATILGINGRSELADIRTATSITGSYSISELTDLLTQHRDRLSGSIDLNVLDITEEEIIDRLNQWARETGNKWINRREVEAAQETIKAYCRQSSERFRAEGIPLSDITEHNSGVDEDVIRAAIRELEGTNTIRTVQENNELVIHPGGMWHLLS